MTKILFLITKSNWGGAQRYVYDLATTLPKNRFSITVSHGEGVTLKGKLRNTHIRTVAIKQLGKDIKIAKEIQAFKSIFCLIKKEKPDIVHLNSSKASGLGAVAARLLGIPSVIFTAHGWPFNEKRSLLARLLIWILSWMTSLFSTRIITVSKKDYRQAQKMPFIKKKVFYIKNGIDEKTHFFEKTEAREKILSSIKKQTSSKIPEKALVIGTIAELVQNKGLSYSLDAFSILHKKFPNKFLYVIIGEGEEKTSLERKVRALHLTEVVFFTGFIKDASEFLRAFDVFLLPSIKEGMPYVLLEAGLSGIPTIATDVGGNSEIIKDKNMGAIISPHSGDAIAEAIQKITSGKRDCGLAFQKRIRESFTLSRMVKETLEVYGS